MARKKACDSCHTKKIHCDGGEPRCEWCACRDIPCTYSRPARKRLKASMGSDSQEELQDQIEQRILRLEGLLGARVNRSGITSLTVGEATHHSSKQDIFYGSLHFAGCNLGDISSQVGIPVFSTEGLEWIRDRTGESTLFHSVYQTPSEGGRYQSGPRARQKMGSSLPPMNVALSCFSVFCSSPLRRVFPIVDPDSFEDTIRRAYGAHDAGDAVRNLAARACVFSFIAATSRFEPEKLSLTLEHVEIYAREAHNLLTDIATQSALEGLQASLMVTIYHDFTGDLESASVTHAIAVRCIYRLSGQLGHRAPSPLTTQKHVRQLFWLCYFFDKHISLRTGQPSSISDIECDLTLHEYIGLAGLHHPAEPLYPSDLRLTAIKSKVSTMLYSPSSLHKSDSELLRDVRELDDKLEEWRLSVPEHVRPHLCVVDIGNVVDILKNHEFGMLVIFIHLEYLYLISAIHRACGRCAAWSDSTHGPEAVTSSLTLSVQASRSSLIYFGAASRYTHRESFWLIIFYPLWATLTIFCNILHDPTHGEISSDIELLGSIPRVIEKMPQRPLTAAELCHWEMLEAFVAELVRLAQCAVSRSPSV